MPHKIILPVVLILIALSAFPIQAQDEVIITIAVEEWQRQFFNDELFDVFEEANPGIKIVVTSLSNETPFYAFFSSAEEEVIAEQIENAQAYVSTADVVPVNTYSFNLYHTRMGAFLDLSPLLNADPNANLGDFYPAMLQSGQWDGGTWMLPISGNVEMMVYDKVALDAANLPYPDQDWTLSDYADAGRALTQYNDLGEITLPGMFGFDDMVLLRSVIGHNFTDPTAFRIEPQLVDPDLISALEFWVPFKDEITPEFEEGRGLGFDFDEIPLLVSGLWRLSQNFGSNDAENYGAALLPGGTSVVRVRGYAISAGTQHPEEAYTLLQWMTQSPEVVFNTFGDRPARRSMIGVTPEDTRGIFLPERDEAVDLLIEEAIEAALPLPEYFFQDRIQVAMDQMSSDGLSAEEALTEQQETLEAILAALDAHAGQMTVEVAEPLPTPVLEAGQVSIAFGIQSFVSPLPNRDAWDAAIDEFTSQDSQVGQVDLQTHYLPTAERAEEQDCFYMNSQMLGNMDWSLMLPVDPFLAADVNYDAADLLTDALQPLLNEGNLYGVPMDIDPQVIWYDAERLEELRVTTPFNGWTVSDFEDILRQYYDATGEALFHPRSFSNEYLLMLIAAYGGTGLGTNESLDLTNPDFIQATQQVLDLAKAGYIDYDALGDFSGGGGGGRETLYSDSFASRIFNLFGSPDTAQPYQAAPFPQGRGVMPITYQLGAGYISAQSAYPEACYRWLSFLSTRPELLNGMPIRRSLLEKAVEVDPNAENLQPFYEQIEATLQDPALTIIQNPFVDMSETTTAYTGFISSMWMNRAFDTYVFEDADLVEGLGEAQQFITEFQSCTTDIPELEGEPAEMEQEELEAYFGQFRDCAVGVDPELEDIFP